MVKLKVTPKFGCEPYQVVLPRNLWTASQARIAEWVDDNLLNIDGYSFVNVPEGVEVTFCLVRQDKWNQTETHTATYIYTGPYINEESVLTAFKKAAWDMMLSERGDNLLAYANGDFNYGDIITYVSADNLAKFGLYHAGTEFVPVHPHMDITLEHDEFPYPDESDIAFTADIVVVHQNGNRDIYISDDIDVDIRSGQVMNWPAEVGDDTIQPTDKVYIRFNGDESCLHPVKVPGGQYDGGTKPFYH